MFCDGAGNCKCRTRSSWNLLTNNPGFDGSASGWTVTPPAAFVSNVDVDSCSGSGSVHVAGSLAAAVRGCTTAVPGQDYFMGYRFKSDAGPTSAGTASCLIAFLTNGGTCDAGAITGGGNVFGAFNNDNWIQAQGGPFLSPAGTTGVLINCTAVASSGYYDQIYLSTSTPGLPAF
jgi:hypothetical protein